MRAGTTVLIIAIAFGNCAFGPAPAWAEDGATAETAAYLQLSPGQTLEGQNGPDDGQQPESPKGNDSPPLAKTGDDAARAARCCAALAGAAAATALLARAARNAERRQEA